ncbi:MAG: hypothetical protein M3X11_20360 [Acidobacteriota bacterium]|nr:hypothetical protein [Acidobacteriota bacterium]
MLGDIKRRRDFPDRTVAQLRMVLGGGHTQLRNRSFLFYVSNFSAKPAHPISNLPIRYNPCNRLPDCIHNHQVLSYELETEIWEARNEEKINRKIKRLTASFLAGV